MQTDQQTGQTIIAGMGELHLEIIVDRLKREFSVQATVGKPQIAYKERLTRAADGDGRYVRQTGSRGQYGQARIHLHPGEPGTGYVFESETVGGAIPTVFIKPIDDGIREALPHGVLAGYPVDDYMDDVVGNLVSRRGEVHSEQNRGICCRGRTGSAPAPSPSIDTKR